MDDDQSQEVAATEAMALNSETDELTRTRSDGMAIGVSSDAAELADTGSLPAREAELEAGDRADIESIDAGGSAAQGKRDGDESGVSDRDSIAEMGGVVTEQQQPVEHNPSPREEEEEEAQDNDVVDAAAADDVPNDGDDTALEAEDPGDEDSDPPPQRPKRAMSAWAFYLVDQHGGRMSKEASDAWKALAEEERAPYVGKATEDKARLEQEKADYEKAYALWATHHPVAARALSGSGEGKSTEEALEPTETYLPLAKVRRMIRTNPHIKNIGKEALFVVVKSTEALLQMLTEQSVTAARKAKHKSVSVADVATVLYGARSADLMHFAHADMPKAQLLAAAAPKSKKPKVLVAGGAEQSGSPSGGKEVLTEARAKKRTEALRPEEELPAQAHTMKHFFEARPFGEPAPPPPPSVKRARNVFEISALSSAVAEEQELDAEESEELHMLEEPEEPEETMRRTGAGRKRRVVVEDDDDDDDEEEKEPVAAAYPDLSLADFAFKPSVEAAADA